MRLSLFFIAVTLLCFLVITEGGKGKRNRFQNQGNTKLDLQGPFYVITVYFGDLIQLPIIATSTSSNPIGITATGLPTNSEILIPDNGRQGKVVATFMYQNLDSKQFGMQYNVTVYATDEIHTVSGLITLNLVSSFEPGSTSTNQPVFTLVLFFTVLSMIFALIF